MHYQEEANTNNVREHHTSIRFHIFIFSWFVGAQDAVAAGTIAAWTSLMANDDTPTVIPEDSIAPLVAFEDEIIAKYLNLPIGFSLVQARAMAAFAFGLACGSASCLQEQNSVLDISDVATLFKETSRSPPKVIISR